MIDIVESPSVEQLKFSLRKLPGAAGGGMRAARAGKNPVWGAVKGAVANLGTGTKVLIVLAAVLGLLLGPVVLVVTLVVLLVLAIVAAVRSAPTPPLASGWGAC